MTERRRVYVETTIPSFYFDTRSEPQIVARREWTRQWWADRAADESRVTSDAVVDELTLAPAPKRDPAIQLIQSLPLLPVVPEIHPIVAVYLMNRLMPENLTGDALHLALASYHKCDALVTWNCKHLANVNKMDHIRQVNTMLGLYVPKLVTPLELIGATWDDSA